MTNLHTASQQWANRPDDERFLSLDDLAQAVGARKQDSFTVVSKANRLNTVVDPDGSLVFEAYDRTLDQKRQLVPSNWAFGQVASLAGAPASYLRKLPTELAAINLQWGLEKNPAREDALILGEEGDGRLGVGNHNLRAVTSTTYGRIWDAEVVSAVQRVNEDGRWVVPAASYTASNPKRATTLYASDRDIFIFLVDPANPVEVGGEQLFRGFYAWNSEVGSATFGLTTFLYRYVCDNRIIWGATDVQELRIRHTGGAPNRFAYEGRDFLSRYANETTRPLVEQIERAQAFEIGSDAEKPDAGWSTWLQTRGFTAAEAKRGVETAKAEEGEARSLWDIVQGITASARAIPHTNDRVELETRAGKLLNLVSGN